MEEEKKRREEEELKRQLEEQRVEFVNVRASHVSGLLIFSQTQVLRQQQQSYEDEVKHQYASKMLTPTSGNKFKSALPTSSSKTLMGPPTPKLKSPHHAYVSATTPAPSTSVIPSNRIFTPGVAPVPPPIPASAAAPVPSSVFAPAQAPTVELS